MAAGESDASNRGGSNKRSPGCPAWPDGEESHIRPPRRRKERLTASSYDHGISQGLDRYKCPRRCAVSLLPNRPESNLRNDRTRACGRFIRLRPNPRYNSSTIRPEFSDRGHHPPDNRREQNPLFRHEAIAILRHSCSQRAEYDSILNLRRIASLNTDLAWPIFRALWYTKLTCKAPQK